MASCRHSPNVVGAGSLRSGTATHVCTCAALPGNAAWAGLAAVQPAGRPQAPAGGVDHVSRAGWACGRPCRRRATCGSCVPGGCVRSAPTGSCNLRVVKERARRRRRRGGWRSDQTVAQWAERTGAGGLPATGTTCPPTSPLLPACALQDGDRAACPTEGRPSPPPATVCLEASSPRPHRQTALPQTSALGTCGFQVGCGVLRAVLSPVIPLKRSPPRTLPSCCRLCLLDCSRGAEWWWGTAWDLGPPVVLGTVALPSSTVVAQLLPREVAPALLSAASWGLPSPLLQA